MSGPITIRGTAPGMEQRENRPEYLKSSGVTMRVLLSSHVVEFGVLLDELKTAYRRIGEFIGVVENGPPKWDKERAEEIAKRLGCLRNDALAALFECEWDAAKAEDLLIRSGTCAVPKAADPADAPPPAPAQAVTYEASATEVVGPKVEQEGPLCPRCKGSMRKKKNKSNGTRFWGCSKYPECRGTVDIAGTEA